MGYQIVINPLAIQDIQQAIDYYDEQKPGLGKKFEAELNRQFLALQKNPFYQIRYDSVRCLPLKKYPFMVHFTVDEELMLINIQSVFNTSRNPNLWDPRS